MIFLSYRYYWQHSGGPAAGGCCNWWWNQRRTGPQEGRRGFRHGENWSNRIVIPVSELLKHRLSSFQHNHATACGSNTGPERPLVWAVPLSPVFWHLSVDLHEVKKQLVSAPPQHFYFHEFSHVRGEHILVFLLIKLTRAACGRLPLCGIYHDFTVRRVLRENSPSG